MVYGLTVTTLHTYIETILKNLYSMILCPDTIYSDITIKSNDSITVDCATQVLCYNPAKEISSDVNLSWNYFYPVMERL